MVRNLYGGVIVLVWKFLIILIVILLLNGVSMESSLTLWGSEFPRGNSNICSKKLFVFKIIYFYHKLLPILYKSPLNENIGKHNRY